VPFRLGVAERGIDGEGLVTGHWEMMGIVLDRAFPVFPQGFPRELIDAFEQRIGRGTLGNYAASGTVIIEELGAEHVRTGKPIVYTSADSVFQIAAHEGFPSMSVRIAIALSWLSAGMASAASSRGRSSESRDASSERPTGRISRCRRPRRRSWIVSRRRTSR
jgi:hypothetical protein